MQSLASLYAACLFQYLRERRCIDLDELLDFSKYCTFEEYFMSIYLELAKVLDEVSEALIQRKEICRAPRDDGMPHTHSPLLVSKDPQSDFGLSVTADLAVPLSNLMVRD